MPWNTLIPCMLIAVNLVLGYSFFFSENGLLAYLDLRTRQDGLQQRILEVDEESVALSQEIRLLKENRLYIEKTIRQQLNYIRPSEVLYLFPEQDDPDAGVMRHAGKD